MAEADDHGRGRLWC